ncbi:hypothetical protein VTO73DRAFT_2794 [Trametes versicolor]
MWLLRVEDATLHYFPDGGAPPYAILSHVWRGVEQTFQDVQAISSMAPPGIVNPAMLTPSTMFPRGLSPKILHLCIYAQKRGYKWAWIDTCCIDKTSSAELSEALNSMYSYYAKAEICFALLDDVRGDEDPRASRSTFRGSMWFRRGWTLQELLAPRAVVFLSMLWQPVGTNHALADVIEQITGIDQAVLTHQRPLREVSVARRMSWAAKRETTRVEDGAYSLMGIFNVFMPAVYGEGAARAFMRLQEEILKQLPDQSIFAWGFADDQADHYETMRGLYRRPLSAEAYRLQLAYQRHRGLQGLLAQSPRDFVHSGNIHTISFRQLSEALNLHVPIPFYHPTSGGLRIQMPVIPDEREPEPFIPGTAATVSSAVLACEDEYHNLVVLYMRRESENSDGWSIGVPTEDRYLRAALWRRPSHRLQEVQIVDFYVIHRHPLTSILPYLPTSQPSVANDLQVSGPSSVFFYFPVWVLARLQLSGFSPAINTGARWGIQPLPVVDGVSAERTASLEQFSIDRP